MKDYSLTKHSPKYKELMDKSLSISRELDDLQTSLSTLEEKQQKAREIWMQAEVDAILDPVKESKIAASRAAYEDCCQMQRTIEEKIGFFNTAKERLTPLLEEAKEEAKTMAFNVARADHEKVVLKSVKFMRELAAAQEDERQIVQGLGMAIGPSSGLTPSYFLSSPLGDENTYGTPFFVILKQLRSRGYKV